MASEESRPVVLRPKWRKPTLRLTVTCECDIYILLLLLHVRHTGFATIMCLDLVGNETWNDMIVWHQIYYTVLDLGGRKRTQTGAGGASSRMAETYTTLTVSVTVLTLTYHTTRVSRQ